MSDAYTPTTEEVREHWRSGWHPRNQEAADASFDAWLAGAIAEKRAEWEAEQGEVEWEYGWCDERPLTWTRGTNMAINSVRTFYPYKVSQHAIRMRRRKAGEWVPVNENGGTQ